MFQCEYPVSIVVVGQWTIYPTLFPQNSNSIVEIQFVKNTQHCLVNLKAPHHGHPPLDCEKERQQTHLRPEPHVGHFSLDCDLLWHEPMAALARSTRLPWAGLFFCEVIDALTIHPRNTRYTLLWEVETWNYVCSVLLYVFPSRTSIISVI